MMTTILTASAVLAAEYGIRTRVNKAPKQQFPKPLGRQYELRQAHNFGLVGSRFEGKPKLVLAYQTGATTVAVIGACSRAKRWAFRARWCVSVRGSPRAARSRT